LFHFIFKTKIFIIYAYLIHISIVSLRFIISFLSLNPIVMKSTFLKIWMLFCIAFSAKAQIKTPQPSPSATISQAIGLTTATIDYSRPSLKGRKMIGSSLVPYGQVWRTGANKIPNLKLTEEVMIEGQKVPAGTYGLVTIPGLTEWTIVLSKKPEQWGVYEYKQEDDLVRFKVKAEKLAVKEEHFTMAFTDFTPSSAKVAIRWENTQVKFNIKHDANAQIMAEIKEKTSAADVKTDTYFDAANYYFENGGDLNQALAWADKVVEKDKQYWTYYLRAKIAAKLGKCDIAADDATKGLELATKEKDNAYIANHTKILKGCGKMK
jgi:Protein of unknown function (DUF2911)